VTRAEEFEQLRALLFAIAYRILGSVSEAEDASGMYGGGAGCVVAVCLPREFPDGQLDSRVVAGEL
jgi:hypothetical protein